jgi:ParB family chromosome partitioning protein
VNAPTATRVGVVLRIPVEQIRPGRNARQHLGDLNELAMSIRSLGLQEPLLVHDRTGWFEIFDGHRRYAAARMAGLTHVEAVLRADGGDARRIQQQLAMHSSGRGFDPISEAEAIRALVFDHMVRPEEVARSVGKSPAWVSSRLALLNLDEGERASVSEGRMSVREAMAVVGRRRAERDGRPVREPQPAPAVRVQRHCRTCACGGGP